MSTDFPTTDDLKGVALVEFGEALPGIEVAECLPPDHLDKHFERAPIGDAIAVVTTSDLREPGTSDFGENEFLERVELQRRTCPNNEVQVHGIVHLNVDRHYWGQRQKGEKVFRLLADQIGAIGPVEWVLIEREPDVSIVVGSKLRISFLARIQASPEGRITIDERGIAWLSNTRLKVREVITWAIDNGWSAWQIYQQYGGTVPLPALHAAFTYFDNHREKILKELDDDDQYVAAMRATQGQPPAVQRLKSNRK